MKGLILLFKFMTRLPMPNVEYDEGKLGKAMKFFPIIGSLIGLIFFIFTFILLFFNITFELSIVFFLLLDVILTGAIHLDGLADTFDGIFSYRSKQKMLEIMKDSRVGTNGAIALIFYFLLKFFLFFSIYSSSNIYTFIIILMTYPVVQRMSSVISCVSAPYAKSSGMGKTFVDNTKKLDAIFSIIFTYLYCLSISSIISQFNIFNRINLFICISISIVVIMSSIFSKLMKRKIGGITGDTLGALLELSGLLYIFIMNVLMFN